MRTIWIWLTLVCCIVSGGVPQAKAEGDVVAKVEVDRAFATIGDHINFRITITHKPEVSILELDVGNVLKDFEIKEAKSFSSKEGGKIVEGKNYVITSYNLGEYVIRPFTIQYRTGANEVSELKTNNLYVTIESVDKNKEPDSDIRGIKGVQKIKGSLWLWLIAIGLAVGVAGLIAWTVDRKQNIANLEKEEILSPHDEAYQALNRLRHSDLIRKGQMKLYFFQMSEILRHYFERRYAIHALEFTTHELMEEIKNHVNSEDARLILEVLSGCDLVKFAKYNPTPAEILNLNNQAKLIVDKTKQELEETLLKSTVS